MNQVRCFPVPEVPISVPAAVTVFSVLIALATYLRAQRASMYAYLQPTEEGTIGYIVVGNNGVQTARNVRFEFSDDPSGCGEGIYANTTAVYVRKQLAGMDTWASGQKIMNHYCYSPNAVSGDPGPQEDVVLTVFYRGISLPKRRNWWCFLWRRYEVFNLRIAVVTYQLY